MSITEIIALILSAFSALGLTAGGVWLRRENKRKANAEAVQVETHNAMLAAHEWRDIATHREEKLKAKEDKIEQLYKEIGKWRDKAFEWQMKHGVQAVELATEKPRICNRPGCNEREPQSGF